MHVRSADGCLYAVAVEYAYFHRAHDLTSTMQVSASSWGVSPVQATYGSLQVLGQHLMVASYGLVNPGHAQIMTHAYTFDGRYDELKEGLLLIFL